MTAHTGNIPGYRRVILPALITAYLVSPLSGGHNQPQSGHTFTVTDHDGVRFARSSAEPKYDSELFRYDQVCELVADERPESIVGSPAQISLDEQGRSYIVDLSRGGGEIAVFSPTGRYLYRISGVAGEAPERFQTPYIGDSADGVLQILEKGRNRLCRYTTAGEFIDDVILAPGDPGREITWASRIADDAILAFHTFSIFRADRQWRSGGIAVFTPALDTLAGISVPELPGPRLYDAADSADRRIRLPAVTPFTTRHIFAWSPRHGIMVTTGAEPELRFCTLEGRHYLTVRIDLPSEPVTPLDRALFETTLSDRRGSLDEKQAENLQRFIDALDYPDDKSFWGSHLLWPVEFDSGGFIWIRIPAGNEHGTPYEDGFTHLLLSPEGEFLGRTQRPPGFTRIQHTRVAALCEDRMSGEQHLQVYRPIPVVEGLDWPGGE